MKATSAKPRHVASERSPTDRLAVADLEGRKATGATHLKLQGGFAWIYNLEGLPRLQIYDRRIKGERTLTWLVDGKGYEALDHAVAAYNGDPMSQEEPKKFSLAQQIEEIDRELEQRASVYPRMITRGVLRQSIADYQVNRLRAARASLAWLQQHELTIKQRLAD